jgi:hypothetical protein
MNEDIFYRLAIINSLFLLVARGRKKAGYVGSMDFKWVIHLAFLLVFVRYYVGRLVASLNCRFAHLFKLQRQPRERRKIGGEVLSKWRIQWLALQYDIYCTKCSRCKPSELSMASGKMGPSYDEATGWPVRGSKPDSDSLQWSEAKCSEVWWSVAECCSVVMVLVIRCQSLLEDFRTIWSCYLYVFYCYHILSCSLGSIFYQCIYGSISVW